MALEDIGEGNDGLLCVTNLTACCVYPYIGNGSPSGNWFFPNGTRVANPQWEFYRERGNMKVILKRKRGGVEGIYSCEIPDSMNVTQTINIGLYTAKTGE